jgi:hypothetical protein
MSSKIPLHLKDSPDKIATGHFCIFTGSLLVAGKIVTKLYALDKKHDGLPAYGQMVCKGKKVYWCKYGFVSDPDIYRDPGKKSPYPRQKKASELSWPATAAKKAAFKFRSKSETNQLAQ